MIRFCLLLLAALVLPAQGQSLLDKAFVFSEESPANWEVGPMPTLGHLVLEYQWRETTWGERADLARSATVTIGTLPPVSIREGDTGSFLSPDHQAPVGWKDVRGFRPSLPLENPPGEWNRLEIIVDHKGARTKLNGEPVTRCEGLTEAATIAIATQGAALEVRRVEIFPLNAFAETWTPEQRSTDTGRSESGAAGAILPRREPWSPEQSQKAWRIDGDFDIQLVAAEPQVCDPVDIAWNEKGEMFVAELRDYSFPPKDGPRLSRIRRLVDLDGDGRIDHAETWADHLPDVQGLLPFRNGLIATTNQGAIFLEDSNGDGQADRKTALFSTNQPRHSQLQLASPAWKLDNTIHFNNGIDGTEYTRAESSAAPVSFKGYNLIFNPFSGEIARAPGIGQFGCGVDGFGRVFFSSNRNPAMFEVIPQFVVERNALAGIRSGHEEIQASGAKIYPFEISHTTAAAHAGTHTAACGLTVYGGDWMEELQGDLLVCDPTAQLVTRNKLVKKGASFEAKRIGEGRDFLVSEDEWCRPVNLKTGPDGALYICDFYRRFIDHEVYFPEDFARTNYMRAGFDHGRIWRLVPKGAAPRKIEPLPTTTRGQIQELAHPNAWRRTQAQQLLVEHGGEGEIEPLIELFSQSPSALARVHALWTLHGLCQKLDQPFPETILRAALGDPDSGVVENALWIARTTPLQQGTVADSIGYGHADARVRMLTVALHGREDDIARMVAENSSHGAFDPWLTAAIKSLSPDAPARAAGQWLAAAEIPETHLGSITDLVEAAAARGQLPDLARILDLMKKQGQAVQTAVVAGLSRGLPRSPHRSLGALIAKPPVEWKDQIGAVEAVLKKARHIALDDKQTLTARLDALSLVQGDLLSLVEKLIAPSQPPEIQEASCRSLSRVPREEVTDFFFARWDSLPPVPRREAIALIAGHSPSAIRLMKKMKAGEISPSAMPAMNRWTFTRSKDSEISALARELFGESDSDRNRVVADYRASFSTEGDSARGRLVFEKAACATCHEGQTQIGPSLADVKNKPIEALLSDILDPNRAVEERWMVYQVSTRNGETYTGLLTETPAAIELSLPGGLRQTIARQEIQSLNSSGVSLMPNGLESVISKEEMIDLIAYLKQR